MLIKEVEARIESLNITNDEELKNANDLAREINKGIKVVKATYKPFKDEALKAHKKIVAEEKRALTPWIDAQNVLKNAIGGYLRIAEEKQKAIEAQAKEAEEFGIELKVEQTPKLEGTHIRKSWDVEIIDENKVPAVWNNHVIRKIDISALREIARFTDGQAEIEGVRFVKKETVVVR